MQQQQIEIGALFYWWGRALKVAKVTGTDDAAPVIVEELMPGPLNAQGEAYWPPGQFAMWSADAVRRVLVGMQDSLRRQRK